MGTVGLVVTNNRNSEACSCLRCRVKWKPRESEACLGFRKGMQILFIHMHFDFSGEEESTVADPGFVKGGGAE